MKRGARNAVRAATRLNVWVYRRTNGRVGGKGMGGLPPLLLSVVGRRSGVLHTVPVSTSTTTTDISLWVRGWAAQGIPRSGSVTWLWQAPVGSELASRITTWMRASRAPPSETGYGPSSLLVHPISTNGRLGSAGSFRLPYLQLDQPDRFEVVQH